eukprot:CCRYP_005168-RA/>CCRYP_005168-RA protein AED:0.19 eAED:0.19 QI:77/1/1/1/0/0/2/116/68
MPHLHNKGFFCSSYRCKDCCHYAILLHNGNYKKDIFAVYMWPQAADIEAETYMRLKDWTQKTNNITHR